MRAWAGALAAAALAAALPACGGSSGGDGTSWSTRAEAICERAQRTIRAGAAPEDVGDLERVMVRAGDEVRRATAEIRELEVPDDQRARLDPVLKDLDAIDAAVERVEDAAAGGRRRDVERAARRLRLDAIDFGGHAKAAGLKRCGLEQTGVAASDAVVAPAFAERIAEAHATFLVAERLVARRYDPTGAVRERASYWVAMFELTERVGGDIGGEYPTTAEDTMGEYFAGRAALPALRRVGGGEAGGRES